MTANTPASTKQRGMGLDELRALPATVSVVTAARALGIGHNKAYELIKDGTFPVPTIPLGSTVRIPTASLWEVLGVSKDQV